MIEKALMRVPFFVIVLVERVNAALRVVRQHCEIKTLHRRCAFRSQLFSNSLLILEPTNLVATRAPVLLDKSLASVMQTRIVQVRSVRVRFRLREREEIGRYVARVLKGKPEVRHDSHVLHLQLCAVVRAARVLFCVEHERKIVIGVVLRR